MDDEGIADGGHRISVRGLQHAGGVDGDMTLRVAQDPENVGGRGVEKAVYFDAVGHPSADYEGISSRGVSGWVRRIWPATNATDPICTMPTSRTGHSRPLATA